MVARRCPSLQRAINDVLHLGNIRETRETAVCAQAKGQGQGDPRDLASEISHSMAQATEDLGVVVTNQWPP